MARFPLLGNFSVAIAAPLLFSFSGIHADAPFWESFTLIISRVAPLLILPIVFSFALKAVSPKAHNWVRKRQVISFYLWAVSLMIVTGSTVEFVKIQDSSNYTTEIVIACGALVVCLVQFALGRWIGGKYGDKPAGGQSLGQKKLSLPFCWLETNLDPRSEKVRPYQG